MALVCRKFTHVRMQLGSLKSKGLSKPPHQQAAPLDTPAVLSLLDKRNVLYVGHVADTANESLFKVGITYRLPQRHATHCRSFPAFDLHAAVAYDRHRQVEDLLLDVARHKDMLRPFRSKDGRLQREVLGVPKQTGSGVILHYLEALIATDAVATHVGPFLPPGSAEFFIAVDTQSGHS